MDTQQHWEHLYQSEGPANVGWFTPRLRDSLNLIDEANLSPDARIIDLGAGASTLVDDLRTRGFDNITLLDISTQALQSTMQRSRGNICGVT
jgi:predicted TPR repeat methyltransferase